MSAIDISYWNNYPDFAQVHASGVNLVIMKCGGGEGGQLYTDSRYAPNRGAARSQGLAVGSYFFNGPVDPTAAADYQFNIIDWKPGDIVAIDVENNGTQPSWNPAQVLAWCQRILSHGVPADRVYVYMSSSLLSAGWNAVAALGTRLWVAQYGYNDGHPHSIPSSGPWPAWSLWQYTSTGTCPGISGNVDTNQIAATVTPVALTSTPLAPTITPKEDEMITLAKATDGPANWGVVYGNTKIVFPGNSVGAAQVRGWTKLAAIQQGVDVTAVKVAALSGEEFAAVFG